MLSDDLELFVIEPCLFVKDVQADSDLADVMQDPGEIEIFELLLIQVQPFSDAQRVTSDPVGVSGRVFVHRFRGERNGLDRIEIALFQP